MGVFCRDCVLLLSQEFGDHLSSCELLWKRLMWAVVIWIFFFQPQPWAGLCQSLLNDRDCERLVDSHSTCTAMESTAVRFPSVVGSLPGFVALLEQLFLMLFGLPALVSGCLLVGIVVLGCIDLG